MVHLRYDFTFYDSKKIILYRELKVKKKFVIKIGSNLLADEENRCKKEMIEWLAGEILYLRKNSIDAVIITSGAIGVGRMVRGLLKNYPASLRQKQALSAIGQPLLMKYYHDIFSELGLEVAQVLLTKDDFGDRERFLNIRSTILTLIEMGIVPVINENDAVATDEIKFGDNDNLSALVAVKIGAAALVILTDVEGLYRGKFERKNLIDTVEKITPEIELLATAKAGSKFGTGGMISKIQAAKISTSSGIKTILCKPERGLFDLILKGSPTGTTFLPARRLESKKSWLAFGAKPRGVVIIDTGAAGAISSGKSLLASGILEIEGSFKSGDVIKIVEKISSNEIARGLTYYSSEDLAKIKGRHSKEISEILSRSGYDEVIHRDNMVVL